jgi:hypothetical protein
MDKKILTAPCGLDCFNCPTYEGNITEELKKWISENYKIPIEKTPCKGCRDEKGNCKFAPNNQCATWNCIHEKGLTFCFECGDFPCEKLMPTQKGAQFPHNMKVYNLCRMKKNGIDSWIEESVEIRKRYFQGKFEVGKGPIL